MSLVNDGLARHIIKTWIGKYAQAHPDIDADALRDWLSDADVESYDSPSDFMKEAARERKPDFFTFWSRGRESVPELVEAYEGERADHNEKQLQRLIEMKGEPTVSLADRIYDLVTKNSDYKPILERILEVEASTDWHDPTKDEGLVAKPYGWRMDEIPGLTGGHLKQLVDLGAVRYAYQSEQYKYFRMDARLEAVEAVELYDAHRAEAFAVEAMDNRKEMENWKALWHEPCPLCHPHRLLDHATENDLELLRDALQKVRDGKEPGDIPDAKMGCFKCDCYIPRAATFLRILATARQRGTLESFRLNRTREPTTSTGFLEGIRVTSDDEAHFNEVLAAHDALDYWCEAVAPKIVGMDDTKRAMLIALASLPDIQDDRNRVHVLLWGEPGTAKTELAREVIRFGGGWADHGTSDVGLTADASQGELTLGLLPMNHNGAVGIDELDKFEVGDQNGVLESMETGQVTVNRGKFVNLRLPAEVVIVATSNRIDRFRAELLDRFDFVVRVAAPTVVQAQDIMGERILWWNRPKGTDTVNLGKYLVWIRRFTPDIPETVRKQAQSLLRDFIEYSGETRIRRLERLIRIALAIARLNRRDVTLADFKRAIKLVKVAHDEAIESAKNGGAK